MCAVAGFGVTAQGAPPRVTFQDGRLSLSANDSSMMNVLESIARVSDLDIFVSEECTLGTISIELVRQPLEKAVKRILTNLNHVMIYREEQGTVRACAIKVFPKGSFGGELIPVHAGSGPGSGTAPGVAETAGGPAPEEAVASAALPPEAESGVMVPSGHVSKKDYLGAFSAMSARFEAGEQDAFRELCELRARVAGTEDGEMKDALSSVLTKKLEEFHTLQRVNRNRVEALHRLSLVTSGSTPAPSN